MWNPTWDSLNDWNILYDECEVAYDFMNPPFKIMAELWDIIIHKHIEGGNQLVLCPAWCLEKDYFWDVVSPLCTIRQLGPLAYEGYNGSNGQAQVLLRFFQPDHADWLYRQ